MNLEKFKPNLIPNHPKGKPVDIDTPIMKNGGYEMYLTTFKLDGCRLQMVDGKVLTRSLKQPGSMLVRSRFQKLADVCKEHNITIDGEFYMHGLKFNAIYRFFSKSNVEAPEYKIELEKAQAKNPAKFADDYDNLSIEFLTTFHKDLKFHLFDGMVLDAPGLTRYRDRMIEIHYRLCVAAIKDSSVSDLFVHIPIHTASNSKDEVYALYEDALAQGYEGLVLKHVGHPYKFGRDTLNKGTNLKLKDDQREYDGIILDIEEGDNVREDAERTTNELGRSVTSKKKADRIPNGKAKGFVVEFEGKGTFTVGLQGFDDEQKKELLENKQSYIGRHFKYTGMPPVKKFPRSVFFKCWRDEK